MQQRCEFTESCPMYKYFQRADKRGYLAKFCEGDYKACERRQLELKGEPVPDNLLPQGGKLWADAARPPANWGA